MSASVKSLIFGRPKKTERKEVADFLVRAFGKEYSYDETVADVDLSFQKHIFAYHFFVGREGGRIVCAGALKKSGLEKDLWGIAWIAVSPSKQRKGYGRAIVGFLEEKFKSEFLKSKEGMLTLSAKKHNFQFYDRLGFKSVKAHNDSRLFYKTVRRPSEKYRS